jgi:rhodanese-related sulfurtransferase
MGEESSEEQDQGQEETITAEEAREVLGRNEAVAVDLRDEEEWREGHLPGARRISAEDLPNVDDLPDQKVIVVCEEGEQSAEVAEKLRSDGCDAVALEGGMNQWRSDDLPMQPSRDPDDDSPI